MTLQGLPYAKELAGISFVTTLPPPMTQLSPMVTPGMTHTCAPIQTLFPMVIGLAYSKPAVLCFTSSGTFSSISQQKTKILRFRGISVKKILRFRGNLTKKFLRKYVFCVYLHPNQNINKKRL